MIFAKSSVIKNAARTTTDIMKTSTFLQNHGLLAVVTWLLLVISASGVPPTLLSATSRTLPQYVLVTYDRDVNATGLNPANYALTNGGQAVAITAASYGASSNLVKLSAALYDNDYYSLTVNNVQDVSTGTPIAANSRTNFMRGAVLNGSFEFVGTATTKATPDNKDQVVEIFDTDNNGSLAGNGQPASGYPYGWTRVSTNGGDGVLDARWPLWWGNAHAGPTHGIRAGAGTVLDTATSFFLDDRGNNDSYGIKQVVGSKNSLEITADTTLVLKWDARLGGRNNNEGEEEEDMFFQAFINVAGQGDVATWMSPLGSVANGRLIPKWNEIPGITSPSTAGAPSNPGAVLWNSVNSTNMGNFSLSVPLATITNASAQITIGFLQWDTGTAGGNLYNTRTYMDNVRLEVVGTTPFLITMVNYDANQDRLTVVWNSTPGATYTLENAQEFVGDGAGTSWDNLTTGITSGGLTTSFVVDAPQPGTYFRIRKE